jgi:hypothetical protein
MFAPAALCTFRVISGQPPRDPEVIESIGQAQADTSNAAATLSSSAVMVSTLVLVSLIRP